MHMPKAVLFHALAALSLGAAPVALSQIAFTDATNAAGVAHTSESYGASFGDLNGDGYLDIFASNHRTQPSMYLNMGNGTFLDVATQTMDWVNRAGADTHGGSWADVDNDGDQDLMVSTGTGNLSQFLINDHQRLADHTVGSGLDLTNLGGRLPVWLDYDGDHLLDVAVAQYGGVAKLFHQNANGSFTQTTTNVKLLCTRFHYAQLFDANADGRVDFLCPDEKHFPQKIYDFSTFPWKKIFDAATPAPFFPLVNNVADSAIADFNNDGRMDVFVLGGTQLRPSSVVQEGDYKVEALLAGGSKGFKFVSTGQVTFTIDWNKVDEGVGTDITKIQIGAGARNPTSTTFTLDPADPTVAGTPPAPTDATILPLMQISYDPVAHLWTLKIVTKLTSTSKSIFSQGYIQVGATAPISKLVATGLWITDKPGRPTLLMNHPGGLADETVVAGLDALVQCVSVTAGDFDNDMYVDLYLACRTGASNIANILYHNNGNGTFTAVPDAGGAAGPVGLAMADGVGTADSVISGDYDVDGFLDLFVTNGFNLRPLYTGGPNKLFHNNGNANHWIELDLAGVNSDRDATGARVYATANGVTQMRVQDGRYHRWSQDSRRIHFGLAGATAVDITVKWPSGAVQTFPAVPADTLYRVTENDVLPVPVALGVAPVYPCGPPTLNGAVDNGVFIWRDCPSGEWRLKTSAAGSSIVYSGTVTSSATFTSVKGVGLAGNDVLDFTTNPNQIAFTFHTSGSATDGVNFISPESASNCLSISAPGIAQVYIGPFRAPVNQPFDLNTQSTCP
jgi:hypothetical protein